MQLKHRINQGTFFTRNWNVIDFKWITVYKYYKRTCNIHVWIPKQICTVHFISLNEIDINFLIKSDDSCSLKY